MPNPLQPQMDVHGLGGPKGLTQTAVLGDQHAEQEDAYQGKKARFLDKDIVDSATGLRHFKLPDLLEPRVKAYKFVRQESPWKSYEKIRELRLGVGDIVTLAQQKRDVVSVRSFRGHDAKEKLQMLQRIQHNNFISVLEIFSSEEAFHIIFERIPISLRHFAGIPYYPDELQLASIVGQVSTSRRDVCNLGANYGRYLTALPISHRKG